jgi:integrase
VPRPRTGTLRRRKNGMVIVEFEIDGQWFSETLGRNLSDDEARVVTKMLMERVNSGDWLPTAKAKPAVTRRPAEVPTYRHMAALCLRDWLLLMESDKSKSALVWQLNLLMDALGATPVDQIETRDIRRAALDLRAERVAIDQARADGAPLMQTVITRTGRRYDAKRRGVNNNGINKGVKTVARVLEDAKTAGYIGGEVPDIKPALLPKRKVQRSFLYPHQVLAMLDAAKLLEDQHRGLDWQKVRYIRRSDKPAVALASELRVSDALIGKVRRGELWTGEPGSRKRNDIPRHAVLGTLVLGGPRVKELCWFDGHHVDLPGRRLRVPRIGTKSVAGVRMVPMLPGLHELLLEHRADRPYGAQEPVFPTRNGTRNTANNVLSRIVAPVREEANRLLAEREQEPIEHLTPHTLRRTFASILALCEVHPRRTPAHGPRGLAHHGGDLRAGSRRLRSRRAVARGRARM